ncbi:16157_t:CDS:2, partial [Cetraspora pellucida]
KIIGLDFNIEDITFTSSLKLVDKVSDKKNEHPSNLYTEDDETSPSRKQELENLLAATREDDTPLPSRIATGYATIVIDTNCLIGDLNMVKKTIQSDNWMVVVPLVVIMKLDGLKLNPPPLGTAASEAITCLEQALPLSKKLRVQTSKGNYVSGINFSEEFDFGEDKKKNLDDLILGICLWHTKNHGDNGFITNQEKKVIIMRRLYCLQMIEISSQSANKRC